jgi:hypothetical protein
MMSAIADICCVVHRQCGPHPVGIERGHLTGAELLHAGPRILYIAVFGLTTKPRIAKHHVQYFRGN